MKKFIGLIIALLFSNHLAFCGQQEVEQPQPFATNGILIFLDNTEKKIGEPLSLSFLDSLTQQAGPVLVSTSLVQAIQNSPSFQDIINNPKSSESELLIAKYGLGWYQAVNIAIDTIISKRTSSASLTNQEKSNITTQIQQIARQMTPALENKLSIKKSNSLILQNPQLRSLFSAAYYKYNWPFNWNDWIIKSVNADLVLLIPKKEIEKRRQQSVNLPATKLFSPLELALGLKIDHMQDVNSVDELVKNYSAPKTVNYFIPALPQIFITNQEYAQVNQQSNTKMKLPTWFIYLEGHGIAAPGMEGRIAKLPTSDFKLFLDFDETKIKTKLLAYASCFAAGANADAVYKDLQTQIYKTYSFTIITAVLIDAPTKQKAPMVIVPTIKDIDFTNKRVKPDFVTHFIPFFHDLTTKDTINYAQVFSYVWPTPDSKDFIQSFPQIKLAGIPWFNVADSNKKVVTIGKTMAKTRTEPLNVTQFFKTDPLAILLQTNVIPFPLIITMSSMPVLVSMLPGEAQHSFKEVQIPNITLYDFIESFEPIIETTYVKRYIFHTLVVKEEKGNSKKTYHNLVVKIANPQLSDDLVKSVFVYQVSQDGSSNYNINKDAWEKEANQEFSRDRQKLIQASETLLKEHETRQLQQFGKARKEKSQKLVLPKEIPAMPGEEKPVEQKPTKLPTPAQPTIPTPKTIEQAKPVELKPVPLPIPVPTIPTPKTIEAEKPKPVIVPAIQPTIPMQITETPKVIQPAKPAPQKIAPIIAPKQKLVAKPIQKAPAKKLSTIQQAKLKKQQLDQAKKAAAKKKQMIAKKKLAAKQAAAKKKAIAKKTVGKKPVALKKK